MVANPAHEIYRASAGAVGCATHRFVKSPDLLPTEVCMAEGVAQQVARGVEPIVAHV
jgi:hypothetical protein